MELNEVEFNEEENKYITFLLGNGQFAISIQYVTEIICIQTITPVPGFPEYVEGIINLRGKVIPVLDIRKRLKKADKQSQEKVCIIIVADNGSSYGLIVDRVSEILTILQEDISELNEVSKNKYILGIGKIGDEVKLIIDLEKLVNFNEN